MERLFFFVFETIISCMIVYIGISDKHFLWITSARSAAVTLSIIGFILCTVSTSIGTFISTAPTHPLTLCAYVLGIILLAAMVSQLFNIKLPFIQSSENALIIIGVCIVLKGFIAQFQNVLVK